MRRIAGGIGMGSLLLLTAGNVGLALGWPLQALLLSVGAAGILLSAGGAVAAERPCPDRPLLLAAILLLAFGLRLAALDDAVHLFVDEMHFVDGITALWDNPTQPLLTPMAPIAAFPWTFAALQTASVEALGAGLLGVRLPSAMLGTLTVAAVYAWASAAVNRRAGLLAALVLATFPPHIHFSRLGLNNIADPFFAALAFALLARGARGGRHGDFAAAGVLLGLTQYFYEGGRLLYPAAALGWWLMQAVGRPRPARRWRDLRAAALAFAVMAAPLYITLAAAGNTPTPRLAWMRLDTRYWLALFTAPDGGAQLSAYLNQQLFPALLHLVARPDGSAFYYGGDTGLILPFILPMFAVGVVWLLMRGGTGRAALVIVLLTALGNSLLNKPDWTARFVVAFPALALIIGVGIDRLAAWLPRARRLALAVCFGLGCAIAFGQSAYYFGPHLARYNTQIRPARDHQDVAWRVRTLPPGTHAYLFTDEETFYPHILSLERFWQTPLPLEIHLPYYLQARGIHRLPRAGDLALFVSPDDRETLRYLDAVFDLPPPLWSPYSVPREKQYALFLIARE